MSDKPADTPPQDTPKDNQSNEISPTEPFFLFNSLVDGVPEIIKNADKSLFQVEIDGYNENTKKRIIEAMAKDPINMLQNPNDLLKDFANRIIEVFNRCNAWDGLRQYPPVIINPSEETKIALFLLVDLLSTVRESGTCRNWIKWISTFCVPERFYSNKSNHSKILKACCLCHRKRKVFDEKRNFWATLDVNNHFTLWLIENGTLKLHMESQISSVKLSHSGKTVKLFDANNNVVKRFIPVDPEQKQLWLQAMVEKDIRPKLPMFFTTMDEPVPEIMLYALYESLLADDKLVLRAITHYQVINYYDAMSLTEALFDIFSYAGKVDELLVDLAHVELSSPELEINTVLRRNTQLTNMFKLFYTRFGRQYYHDFLRRVVIYIDSKGDLQLKTPSGSNEQTVKTMVFTVLSRVASSLKHISPQIRHFASILKTATSLRFNSYQATYNSLSGFIYLRYLSPILSAPKEIDPDVPLQNASVLIPTAQLLIQLFNLHEMSGKYEVYNGWNQELQTQIFPKLKEFVFSVATVEEQPEYPVPSKERVIEALRSVYKYIGNSKKEFVKKYEELANTNKSSLVGSNLAALVTGFFKQNYV